MSNSPTLRQAWGSGSRWPSSRHFALLAVLALVISGLALVLSPASADAEAARPWVTSDKEDYPPGALVTLGGGDWQPGESVHINVNDDQGRTWNRDVDVVADAAGAIRDSFNLPDWFVATYQVVATGAVSGVATHRFTDGVLKARVAAPATAADVEVVEYSQAGCAGTGSAPVTKTLTQTDANMASGAASVKLTASANDGAGGSGTRVFANWSGDAPVSRTGRSVCFDTAAANQSAVANYAASAATTTTLTSSANPSVYGDAVTFTAAVTSTPSNPTAGTVTFRDGTTVLCSAVALSGNTADCTVPASAALQPGDHAVTASYSPATGFQGSTSLVLTQRVTKRTLAGVFTASDKAYDGSTTATILTRSLTGGTVGSDVVTLSGGEATFDTAAVGTAKTVTGTGFALSGADAGKYQLASSTLTTLASIAARGVTVSFVAADRIYDGTTAATITSTDVSGELEGDSLTTVGGTAAFADRHAGDDKPVTASGFTLSGPNASNYAIVGVTPTTADIAPLRISGAFTAADKPYDGTATATISGRSLLGALAVDDVVLTGGEAAFATETAGRDKPVTGTGFTLSGRQAGNYVLTSSTLHSTASITPLSVVGHITASDKDYDATTAATVTRSLTGQLVGDDVRLDGGTAAFDTKDVGEGKQVTLTGATLAGEDAVNYALSPAPITDTAEIRRRALTVTADNGSMVYGDPVPTLTGTITGVQGGEDVTLRLSTDVRPTTGIGTYPIVPSAAGEPAVLANYTVSATHGTLTVTPAPLTVTAHDKTKVYGDGTPTLTGTIVGVKNGDAVTLGLFTADDARSGVGTYDIQASAQGLPAVLANYAVTARHGTLTVTPAPLTVTADNKTKVYGDGTPTLTGTIVGVKNGDAVTLGLFTADDARSGVGTYDIQASAQGLPAVLANYAVTARHGTLTVTPAPLTVTADNKTKVYGDGTPTLTGTIVGVKNGDAVTLGLFTADDARSGVGTYAIQASAQGLPSVLANYTVTARHGTLTVTPAPLTVTAHDKSMVYGEERPTLTGSITGVRNGEAIELGLSTTAVRGSDAGTYPIVATAVAMPQVLANYTVTATNGTLTVRKASLTVTAENKARLLGAENPPLTYTVTGLVNGDTGDSALQTAPTLSTTATPSSGVGSYPITVSGGTARNYEITRVDGTLRVEFGWAGFLQPINDTGHQSGTQSRFKLGQTIPVKFVLTDAFGNVVQQDGSPTFSRSAYRGACDSSGATESPTTVAPSSGGTFAWTGAQYHYNWSTKGISQPGEYRIYANLADGTQRAVDICLTK